MLMQIKVFMEKHIEKKITSGLRFCALSVWHWSKGMGIWARDYFLHKISPNAMGFLI